MRSVPVPNVEARSRRAVAFVAMVRRDRHPGVDDLSMLAFLSSSFSVSSPVLLVPTRTEARGEWPLPGGIDVPLALAVAGLGIMIVLASSWVPGLTLNIKFGGQRQEFLSLR